MLCTEKKHYIVGQNYKEEAPHNGPGVGFHKFEVNSFFRRSNQQLGDYNDDITRQQVLMISRCETRNQ